MLPTINRKNIYEHVIEHLREYIVTKNLQPGDRLPTESDLAKSFGVSRASIREAVKVLENYGVIQTRPRDGIRVRQISTRYLTNHLKFLLELDGVSIREMAAARQAIEKASIPMVLQHAMEEDFERLQAAIDSGRALTERGELCSTADLEFHLALAAASKNRVIQGLAGMLYEFFAAISVQVLPDKEKQFQSLEEHQQIVHALRAGDATAAQHALEIHLRGYEQYPDE